MSRFIIIVIHNQQAALLRTHESFLATSLNGYLATTTQASSLMTSTYKGCFRLTKWTFRSVPVCQHVNRMRISNHGNTQDARCFLVRPLSLLVTASFAMLYGTAIKCTVIRWTGTIPKPTVQTVTLLLSHKRDSTECPTMTVSEAGRTEDLN